MPWLRLRHFCSIPFLATIQLVASLPAKFRSIIDSLQPLPSRHEGGEDTISRIKGDRLEAVGYNLQFN